MALIRRRALIEEGIDQEARIISGHMLKEFLFPLLLAAASTVPGVIALYSGDYARRWFWTLTLFLLFLSALVFIWGDPVRGPFYRLANKQPANSFVVHGAANMKFSFRDLTRGLDITQQGFKIGGNPVTIFVQRTWLFGWRFDISMNVGGKTFNIIQGSQIGELPPGWDLNHDDAAIEVVNENGLPILQIITRSDYDIYINLVVIGVDRTLIINNTSPQGGRISQRPTSLLRKEYLPSLLFRYPSYSHFRQRS